MAGRALTDAEKRHLADAAELIRRHFWRGKTPPPSPDRRPWTMARELNVWKRLLFAGYPPEHINGAITVARDVRPTDGPMRMTWFYHCHHAKGWSGAPLLNESIGVWLKREERAALEKQPTIPTLRDIFRRMAT